VANQLKYKVCKTINLPTCKNSEDFSYFAASEVLFSTSSKYKRHENANVLKMAKSVNKRHENANVLKMAKSVKEAVFGRSTWLACRGQQEIKEGKKWR